MPNFCAAPNCTRKSTQSDLAFFRFPRDPSRCQKWVENCRRSDLEDKTPDQLNKHYRLCAQHFEDSMICRSSPYRTVLRENAIPTIFDLTSHLGNPGRRRKRIKELSEDEIRTLKENKRTEMVFGLHPTFGMASKSFLDIELLIALVRLHPELYDPRNASYNDTDRRWKLWNQISAEIFMDWDELSPQQRYIKVKEVETQWQSLREHFQRDLLNEMKHNGPPIHPKPVASHFKDLLFLKPVMMIHATEREAKPPAGMKNEQAETAEDDLDIVFVKEEPSSLHPSSAHTAMVSQTATHPTDRHQHLLADFRQNMTGQMDRLADQDQKEDPHMDFARSLVPYLAQVPDSLQTSLRMALTNVIFCYIENTQGHTPTASPQLLQYISPHVYPPPSTRDPFSNSP